MQTAEELSITLPAEMVRAIRARVQHGDYASSSEVVREAVRGWLDRESRRVEIDAAIERGIADADAGRVQGSDDLRRDLLARLGLED